MRDETKIQKKKKKGESSSRLQRLTFFSPSYIDNEYVIPHNESNVSLTRNESP